MTASESQEVALIVGGGPGVSASCARLFAREGMRVAVAARNPEKRVLQALESECGIRRFACDAREPADVAKLFAAVSSELAPPKLVVHNIDGRSAGIFRKSITEADPEPRSRHDSELRVQRVSRRPAGGREHARRPRSRGRSPRHDSVHQRERRVQGLSPERRVCNRVSRKVGPGGKHGARAHAPGHSRRARSDRRGHRLDARRWKPIPPSRGGHRRRQHGRPRPHRRNLSHLHRQHRSTWAFEVVLRPWLENW